MSHRLSIQCDNAGGISRSHHVSRTQQQRPAQSRRSSCDHSDGRRRTVTRSSSINRRSSSRGRSMDPHSHHGGRRRSQSRGRSVSQSRDNGRGRSMSIGRNSTHGQQRSRSGSLSKRNVSSDKQPQRRRRKSTDGSKLHQLTGTRKDFSRRNLSCAAAAAAAAEPHREEATIPITTALKSLSTLYGNKGAATDQQQESCPFPTSTQRKRSGRTSLAVLALASQVTTSNDEIAVSEQFLRRTSKRKPIRMSISMSDASHGTANSMGNSSSTNRSSPSAERVARRLQHLKKEYRKSQSGQQLGSLSAQYQQQMLSKDIPMLEKHDLSVPPPVLVQHHAAHATNMPAKKNGNTARSA